MARPRIGGPARGGGRPDAADPLDVDGFVAGEWHFATPAGAAIEVLDPSAAYRLPRTRRWLAGMINVHGAPVPLFDLAALLGIPAATQRKVMVFDAGGDRAALLVDGLPRRLRIAPQPMAYPPELPTAVVEAIVGRSASDPSWLLLDAMTFFSNLGRSARL